MNRVLRPDEVARTYTTPKPSRAELASIRDEVNKVLRECPTGVPPMYCVDSDNFRPLVENAVCKELEQAGWVVEKGSGEYGRYILISRR